MSKVHPEATGSSFNSAAKKFLAQQFDEKAVILCQFCGGQGCPQEDYTKNKIQPNAVQGLHSNWITDDILAMQRPSDRIIKEYKIYQRFKNLKINTILNLQEPGQHPYCGDGLLSKVGFSYDPEGFFAQGIRFYNESWQDMTATTFQHMMRIMNIFNVSIIEQKGRISVHCHAGRGRTLLVICSWLIYNDRYTAKQTIDLAVQRRQGVLTRSSQRQFLHAFQKQLQKRWKSFGIAANKNFSQYLTYHKTSLLKQQQKIAGFKPYVHACILAQLRRRYQSDEKYKIQTKKAINGCEPSQQLEQLLTQLKIKINEHRFFNKQLQAIHKLSVTVLIQLLFDFYQELPFVILSAHSIETLKQQAKLQANKNKLQLVLNPALIHQTEIEAVITLLDFTHLLKTLVEYSQTDKKVEEQSIKNKEQNLKIQANIQQQCLFVRIAIALASKKKYCPAIFPVKTPRKCKLKQYSTKKRQMYTDSSIIYLANFMKQLTKQIPQNLSEMNEFIIKVRTIDSNLHYYVNQHQNQKGQFLKHKDAEGIYQKSKI